MTRRALNAWFRWVHRLGHPRLGRPRLGPLLTFGTLVLIAGIYGPLVQARETLQVALINPDRPGNPFWDQVVSAAHAAAEDLGIELTVVHGMADRRRTTQEALRLLSSTDPPGYLLCIYQHGEGSVILEAAERVGVNVMLFNTGIPEADLQRVGRPGAPYSRWIGHLQPDDRAAGRDLALHLVRSAETTLTTPTARLVGFTGGRDSSAALARNEGLRLAMEESPQAVLRQLLVSDWEPDIAKAQTAPLLRRYPDANLVWAASDAMALAVVDELETLGRKPGRDVLVGGIDWTPEGVRAVAEGRLDVTLGGHFLDAAWSLVLIHDHYHGLWGDKEPRHRHSRLSAITSRNVHHYQRLFGEGRWSAIDFGRFSRIHKGADTGYDFSLEAILHAVSASTPDAR